MIESRRLWRAARLVLIPVAGVLLGFATVRRIDLATLPAALQSLSISHLTGAAAALICFYFLRAVRWAVILRRRVGVLDLFRYSSIGYLASTLVPFQFGEVVKPSLLAARHAVPFAAGLASVVVERLLDLLGLLTLGLAALVMADERALPPFLVGSVWALAVVVAIAGPAAVVLSGRADLAAAYLRRALRRMGLGSAGQRAEAAAGSLLRGVQILRTAAPALQAYALTILMWSANLVSVGLALRGAGLSPDLGRTVLGFVGVTAGLIVPVVPGYIGQYEALWTFVFAALGFRPETAVVAAGLILHTTILGLISVLGGLALATIGLSLSDAFTAEGAERL